MSISVMNKPAGMIQVDSIIAAAAKQASFKNPMMMQLNKLGLSQPLDWVNAIQQSQTQCEICDGNCNFADLCRVNFESKFCMQCIESYSN